MAEVRATNGPRRVGFQGALGAFSEEAALALAASAEPIPHASFEAVVRAVESGDDDGGVLPVENSLAGSVVEAYDALANGLVRVVAEVTIPIRHCLLGVPGASSVRLREVRSHPVALAQCRRFFEARPDVRARAVYDTAGAAEEVAEFGDPGIGAIASARAGERYGLRVLRRDLQDRDDNQTRFYLIARERAGSRGAERPLGDGIGEGIESPAWPRGGAFASPDSTWPGRLKTSFVSELENRPGSLHGLLGVFADRGLSLTHVTSRPAPTPWTYRFIVEFVHASLEDGAAAVDEASAMATELRVLGTAFSSSGSCTGTRSLPS